MRLSTIALGNLRRRRGRTLLLIAGLGIGVAMVVAMLGIVSSLRGDVERKLDEFGANIVIVPRTEDLALSYGGVTVSDASYEVGELSDRDLAALDGIPNRSNLRALAPKVIGALGGRLVVGIDLQAERQIKQWWRFRGGTGPQALREGEVLLGSLVAAASHAEPGGTLRLGARDYTVVGVLEPNASQDDGAVFMGLAEAQRALGKPGRLSMIEVSALCGECPIDHIVAQMGERLPHARVSAVRQAMALKMQTVDQVTRFSMAASGVVLVIGGLVVFVSMLGSVQERTREIGVLRAIGFRQSHVLRILLLEALVVSVLAGLAGWAVGSSSSWLLAPQLDVPGGPSTALLPAAVLLSLALGMASSIYPALRAARLDPAEALRSL